MRLTYDIMRCLVISFKDSGPVVFCADLLYSAFAGVVTFIFFVLFTKGTIRFYALLGEGIGFAVTRFTLSYFLRRCILSAARFIRWVSGLILNPVIRLSSAVGTYLKKVTQSVGSLLRKAMGNLITSVKKLFF